MNVSEDTLRIWLREAKAFLHRCWDHPAYDDLVAEAYLAMWEAISRTEEGTVRDLHAYAMRAAWNGAQEYLSSARNEHRTYNVFKKKAVTPTLYWEDVKAGRHEEWTPRALVEPDFAPRLVEWLAAQAELAKRRPAEQAALRLCTLQGLTREEARLQLGFSRTKIDRLLARAPRAAIPYAHLPPPNQWRLRKRNERGQFAP